MKDNEVKLGRIGIGKKTLRIEDLEDKVHFAIDAYKRAFDKYKQGVDSVQDWDMVIKALSIQLEELRDFIAVAHHNIGVIYASKGKFPKSIEHLEQALKFNLNYSVAHYNLGKVLKKVGEIESAEKHLEAAKQLGFDK